MESLFGDISQLIQNNPWLAFVAVFIGGILTASNPCVLAMIPLTVGMIGGYKETKGIKKAFFFSLVFVLGLCVTFTFLGIIAALTGKLMGGGFGFFKYIVAGICFIMGLYMMGVIQFNIPALRTTNPKYTGILGAFILGLIYGFVATPCAVPILAVLLAFIATKGNIVYGISLLLVYALGHTSLIIIAGTSIGAAKAMLESKGFVKTGNILRKVAGALIILVGFFFLMS